MCRRIRRHIRQVLPVFLSRTGGWIIPQLVLPAGDGPLDVTTESRLNQLFQDARKGFPQVHELTTGQALVSLHHAGIQVVMLALHGTFGEDGRIQGMLEMAGFPYTGSGVLASAVAMDKPWALSAFKRVGLAIPQGVTVSREDMERPGGQRPVLDDILAGAIAMKFPLFVKPAEGGSSVGTGSAENPDQLIHALKRVFEIAPVALVESAVVGREISVGVIEVKPGKPVALPPTEIILQGSEFFDYEAKYTPGRCREVTPAEIPSASMSAAMHAALAAHSVLGCYGYSRTDMILPADGQHPVVLLETNTLPGMTPMSILPQQAAEAGIPFEDLLDLLLAQALARGTPLATTDPATRPTW
jgi:D-alanine-D-alanine ligase